MSDSLEILTHIHSHIPPDLCNSKFIHDRHYDLSHFITAACFTAKVHRKEHW